MNRAGSLNPNWKGGISTEYYRYKLKQWERYPERLRARELTRRAIKAGKIIRQDCQVCGNPNTQPHHPDYNFPMLINWLCVKHHREAHNGMGVGRVNKQ